MYQPALPAAPRAPALAPLSRTQALLMDGMFRGELDEVLARLPAFDRVPFAAPGGIDNQFLDAILRREEPRRGLPAVPVAVVSKRYQLWPRDMQAEAQLTAYGARMHLQVRLPRELDFAKPKGRPG